MSDQWRTVNPESAHLRYHAGGTPMDGHRFFVAGGFDCSAQQITSSCGYYDAKTETWTSLPDLPFAVSGCRAAFVAGNVYVVGGIDSSGKLRSDIICLQNQRWLTVGKMYRNRLRFACVSWRNDIYVFGGRTIKGPTNTVEKFNTITFEWTQLPNMPSARADCGAAVVDDTIYVVGGSDENDSALLSIIAYDAFRQEWVDDGAAVCHTKRPRVGSSVVAVDEFVVAISGNSFDVRDTIEVLDTNLNDCVLVENQRNMRRSFGTAGFLSDSKEIVVVGGLWKRAKYNPHFGDIIKFGHLQPQRKFQPNATAGRSDKTKDSNDQLEYNMYADALVKVVQTIENSGGANFAVGLMASWGVGKTKLWYLIKEKIKKDDDEPREDEIAMYVPMSFGKFCVRVARWQCFKDDEENQVDCEEKYDAMAAMIVVLFPFLYAHEYYLNYGYHFNSNNVEGGNRSLRKFFRNLPLVDELKVGWKAQWGRIFGDRYKAFRYAVFLILASIWVVILAIAFVVNLVVPFFGLRVYVFYKRLYQNEALDEAQDSGIRRPKIYSEVLNNLSRVRNIWSRLNGGHILSPNKVMARTSSVSLPALLRILILTTYWMIAQIVPLLGMLLLTLTGICFGHWSPKRSRTPDEAPKHKKHIFIDFNAWVYDGSDVLWASLMLKMLTAVKAEYPKYKYPLYKLKRKLAQNSINSDDDARKKKEKFERAFVKYWIRLLLFTVISFGTIAIGINFLLSSETDNIPFAKSTIALLTGLLTLSKVVSMFAFTVLPGLCVDPTEKLLKKAIHASGTESHDFSINAGFMGKVKAEMESLSEFLQIEPIKHNGFLRKPHLSISVDDLDRCDSKTVVQVLRAVTLLLEGQGEITFWLAIDPQIVEAAIDESCGEFLRNAGVDGVDFLEKIIQLPFCIPQMNKQKKDALMARMIIPDSPTLKDVETMYQKFRRQIDNVNMEKAASVLKINSELQDLERAQYMFSEWKNRFPSKYDLQGFLKQSDWAKNLNLDAEDENELLSIAMEYIQHLGSIHAKFSVAIECQSSDKAGKQDKGWDERSNESNESDPDFNADDSASDSVQTSGPNTVKDTGSVTSIASQMADISSDDEHVESSAAETTVDDTGDHNNTDGNSDTEVSDDDLNEGNEKADDKGENSSVGNKNSFIQGVSYNIGDKSDTEGGSDNVTVNEITAQGNDGVVGDSADKVNKDVHDKIVAGGHTVTLSSKEGKADSNIAGDHTSDNFGIDPLTLLSDISKVTREYTSDSFHTDPLTLLSDIDKDKGTGEHKPDSFSVNPPTLLSEIDKVTGQDTSDSFHFDPLALLSDINKDKHTSDNFSVDSVASSGAVKDESAGVFQIENKLILSTEEWYWIKGMSKYFPGKARKIKRIFNVYNVARYIFEKKSLNLKGNDDRRFRRKMMKAIVLAEIWPQKTAWILQVAEHAYSAEKSLEIISRGKTLSMEDEAQWNELVRRLHEIHVGDKSSVPTIESIFEEIPLAVVYRAITEPLMNSASELRFLSSQQSEVNGFERLLKESDEDLKDELTLSDVYPIDYLESFDQTKPSLIPFMFNMQNYHRERASFEMSQIIIRYEKSNTATGLNIKSARKSACYSQKPIHRLDISNMDQPANMSRDSSPSLQPKQTNKTIIPSLSTIDKDRTPGAPVVSKQHQLLETQQAIIMEQQAAVQSMIQIMMQMMQEQNSNNGN